MRSVNFIKGYQILVHFENKKVEQNLILFADDISQKWNT